MDIVLANPGEGIEGGTVTAVFVKVGDAVKNGQALVEVSTDKASMEVTAEADGVVETVHVKPGDKVSVGGKLVTLKGEAKAGEPAPQTASTPATSPPPTAPVREQTEGSSVDVVLANPGEGIEGGTVTAVFVKVGGAVKAGQALVEVSTDKASMEVTAEADGVVETVHVKPGDKVSVGGKLVTLKMAAPTAAPTPSAPKAAPAPRPAVRPAQPAAPGQLALHNGSPTALATKVDIPAGPATRKLARELGIALAEVRGSARGGRITLDDVKAFVKLERQRTKEAGGPAIAGGIIVNAFNLPPLPDFSKFGPVEVTEVAPIRQTIAKNLTVGWRTMPMVTQHDLADITELEAGRKRIVDALPKGSPKITMTVLAVKACVAALKEFPRFNSSYDMNAGKLISKKYYHIGIAVDTERGLVVPVIRDADKKSIRDLAAEVAALADKARNNKLGLDEMRGGTFTITNLGGIGGTAFTPIVNYPEVAILGLSKSALQPVVKDGSIVARLMMPLSLTYDHRVIDGADGCRFTVRLAQLFSDPLRLLMET
jgi:pyruvate dehydrogenase E2 component (dihydrolipoamide acetyltransferase)